MSRAAAAPWTTRAATRKPALGATPQAAEARVNKLRPMTYSTRLPYRSPSLPAVISPAASARPYPATMNWIARGSRVQGALGIRQGHVDDEEVKQGDEGPGKQDGQRRPRGAGLGPVSGGARAVEVITCSLVSYLG